MYLYVGEGDDVKKMVYDGQYCHLPDLNVKVKVFLKNVVMCVQCLLTKVYSFCTYSSCIYFTFSFFVLYPLCVCFSVVSFAAGGGC